MLTNAGRDFVAKQVAGAASATAVAKFVGITANATAPAAGDTSLTAEIVTAGGGLIRQTGIYAHTNGTASYTITSTFTANGTDTLPVTIAKRGVFDQVAIGGTLVYETMLTPTTATLSAVNDSLTVTDTVTIS